MTTAIMSLADLASLDVTDVAEVRFELLPPGIYGFQVEDTGLALVGSDDKPVARIKCKVLACSGLVRDDGVDPATLVGKTHTESLFIGLENPLEGIGRIRAFLADAGAKNVGTLGAILEAFKGHQFKARIHERVKGSGASKETYANIRFDGMPEPVQTV